MSDDFDEIAYLRANPDVQALLDRGIIRSGLEHWRNTGAEEHARGLRRSGFLDYDVMYDEESYLAQNEDVARAVRNGEFASGYQHWNRIGRHEHAAGRRSATFPRMGTAVLNFHIQVPDRGRILAAATVGDFGQIVNARLHLDGATAIMVDATRIACTERLQFVDDRGGTTAGRLLLLWVPDEQLARAGHGTRAATLTATSQGSGIRSVTFHDGGLLPRFHFASLDDARRFVIAAKRIAAADAFRSREIMTAVSEFTRGRLLWDVPASDSEPLARVHVEKLLCIDGVGAYAQGWLIPTNPSLDRCRAFCFETGECVEVHAEWSRSRRPDVAESFKERLGPVGSDLFGFAALVRAPEASRWAGCHIAFGITPKGGSEYLAAPIKPLPAKNFTEAAKTVLSGLDPAGSDFEKSLENCVGPALVGLWTRERDRKSRQVSIREFGSRVTEPIASVIVPIFGRHDFMKYQLSLFAGDEDFAAGRIELIYFIDDPRIIDTAVQFAQAAYASYRVPGLVAYSGENHGFAGANNLAATVARGELLVLLNSDVMPKRPGWVRQIADAQRKLPDCGVIGVKLLYYDDSLQHDGMIFERFPFWGGLYGNNHPGKGLPNRNESGAPAREVEAVTGACLAISRDLYARVGGFSEDFIIGDFEDSELCLKLWSAGKRVYYLPSVELYHLERQSQMLLPEADSWRWQLTVFNSWTQHRKWGTFIDELKRSRAANMRPRARAPRNGSS